MMGTKVGGTGKGVIGETGRENGRLRGGDDSQIGAQNIPLVACETGGNNDK